MQFVRPIPFTEALTKLGRRSVIGSKLASDEWAQIPVALRERAFFSSRIESIRFLDRSKSALEDFLAGAREQITLPDGTVTTALKTGGRAQFVEQMREFALAEGMGPIEPGDAGTIKDIRSQRRLELIYDTQIRQAHDYGNWKQGVDPDVLDEFPAQRFIRVQDVKEPRDMHTLHEGEVQLKSDVGFWSALNRDFGVPWGPWGWGCGHDVEDVDRAEAEALGLLAPGQAVEAPELPLNDGLRASVTNLSPEMQDLLSTAFGDQIKIEAGAAWWQSASHY